MPAAIFQSPFTQFSNANGLSVSGAGLRFTLAETTTLATIYADSELSVQMANPVIADAAGRIPAVYLDSSVNYRVDELDAGGAVIQTIDNYLAPVSTDEFLRTVRDVQVDLAYAVAQFDEKLQAPVVVGEAAIFRTWELALTATGLTEGQNVIVLGGDSGTHTDPVVGGTVENSGVYAKRANGLERIGELDSTIANMAADRAEAAAAESAGGTSTINGGWPAFSDNGAPNSAKRIYYAPYLTVDGDDNFVFKNVKVGAAGQYWLVISTPNATGGAYSNVTHDKIYPVTLVEGVNATIPLPSSVDYPDGLPADKVIGIADNGSGVFIETGHPGAEPIYRVANRAVGTDPSPVEGATETVTVFNDAYLYMQFSVDRTLLSVRDDIANIKRDVSDLPAVKANVASLEFTMEDVLLRLAALEAGGGGTPTPSLITGMLIGSSTPARYFTTGSGPANSEVTVSTDGITFTPLGTTGAGATTYGNVVQTATAKPVRLINKAVAGTKVLDWDADTNGVLTAAINAATAAGGLSFICMALGFNDANSLFLTSDGLHLPRLRSLASKLRTGIGNPNLPIIIGMSQKYGLAADANKDTQFNRLNLAELQFLADQNIFFGAHAYDLAQLSDGIHQTEASYPIHATRWANNTVRVLQGQTPFRGPTATSAASVSTTQTDVTIAHSGGTDIQPSSGASGFTVFDGNGSALAVSAVNRLSATSVRLTHAAATAGATIAVRVMGGANPDRSAPIKDNNGLPISPTGIDLTAVVGGGGTPTPTPTPNGTARINFCRTTQTAVAGWQNWSATDFVPVPVGTTINLNDSTSGSALGWTMTVTKELTGPSQFGVTSGSSGLAPSGVMQYFWFVGIAGSGNPTQNPGIFSITGLNPAKKYAFQILSSRASATTPRTAKFTAAGTNSGEATIDGANNATLLAQITNISPTSGGVITFTIEAVQPDGNYGYINGLTIVESD